MHLIIKVTLRRSVKAMRQLHKYWGTSASNAFSIIVGFQTCDLGLADQGVALVFRALECTQVCIYFQGRIWLLISTLHFPFNLTHFSLLIYKVLHILWLNFLQLPQIKNLFYPCENKSSFPFRIFSLRHQLSLWSRVFLNLHVTSCFLICSCHFQVSFLP